MEALGIQHWRHRVGVLREMALRRATYFERWKLFVLVRKVQKKEFCKQRTLRCVVNAKTQISHNLVRVEETFVLRRR